MVVLGGFQLNALVERDSYVGKSRKYELLEVIISYYDFVGC